MAGVGGLKFISAEAVRSVVSMAEVIEVVEKGLSAFSSSQVVQPVRSFVPVAEHQGFLALMPSYCSSLDVLATKLITYYPNNINTEVRTFQAMVILMEASTGSPLALIDGEVITTIRTAAASAVAFKYMRLPTIPRILCIIGTGVQARSHAEALRAVQDFDEIRVWGRNPVKASQCASDIGGDNVQAYHDIEAACRDADVIVTVTMTSEPVLKGVWLKDNTIVIGVGACRPDRREFDDDVIRDGLVLVDSREAALKESGDILLGKAEIHCEIGELIGKNLVIMETARSKGKRLLVFKSLGIGVEDAVTGKLVYDNYNKANKQ